MIDKILGFFSGLNGNKTTSEVKRDVKRHMAFTYQMVKRNTPGVMKEWSILGTIDHGYGIEEIDNLKSRLSAGEMMEIKAEPSNSFTDRVALHQVITRDDKMYMHLFRDSKYSNGMDDYIATIEISKKFPIEHLPQDSKVLQSKS